MLQPLVLHFRFYPQFALLFNKGSASRHPVAANQVLLIVTITSLILLSLLPIFSYLIVFLLINFFSEKNIGKLI